MSTIFTRALLPFLILKHDLSYSAAAVIVFAFTGTATIIQPLLGFLADRFSISWIIPAGVMLTGIGFSFISIATTYSLLITAVVFSGIASAVFHPKAARMVNYAGGERKATAMSFFGVGGVLGFSIGPFVIKTAVLAMGLKGAMVTMIAVVLVSCLFLLQSSQLITLQRTAKGDPHTKAQGEAKDRWFPFLYLRLSGNLNILFVPPESVYTN